MRKNQTKMTDDEYQVYMHSLSSDTLSSEHKKYILSALAISSDVRAYRLLEDYAQHAESDVTNWAYMALLESRISLESELLEEKQIYISTGLGGRGNKLRFYVLITASKNEPFQAYQRQTVESEFTYYLPTEDIEIERLTVYDLYVELILLIPVQKDIKAILDRIIAECNQYGNFISNTITVTNVKELSADEVAEIIRTRHAGKNSKTGR
ncbi:MAG: hypothetical protein LBP25_03970 [Tannerellaceae bacterium]|nr:hypothetical protein [Tannerellaceae bacterium]